MGLFGKKKQQDESDRLEQTMRNIYAPKVPENPDPWLSKSSVSFPPLALFGGDTTFLPNAWFNVEVASMQISTRIPVGCEECSNSDEAERECSRCGKNDSNFTTVMTANADGDYLGWEMFTDEMLKSQGVCQGFFVTFDRSVKYDFDGVKLTFESQPLAPILVKSLKVNPYTQNLGMLFFADAFAVLDGSDFISGIKVIAGEYFIVAWVGYTMNGLVAPFAVTVLNEELMRKVDFQIPSKNEVPEDIKKSLTNSIDGTVLARFGANMEALAQDNASFYADSQGTDAFIADSWATQIASKENPELFADIEREAFGELPRAIALVECLRLRGQQKLALQEVRKLEERFSNIENSDDRALFGKIVHDFKLFPPGSHVVTVITNLPGGDIGEAEELNNQGFEAWRQGRQQEGMALLHKAALMGQPNALANYTWFALRDGDFKKAIDLYEESIQRVSDSHDSAMIMNCKGNYALLLAAIGDLKKAIKVSEECLDAEQYETHFFLAMMFLELGDQQSARTVFKRIPKSSHSSIKKTLTEEFTDGTGWFAEWCGKGISTFSELVRD